jgi:hypothetical protein
MIGATHPSQWRIVKAGPKEGLTRSTEYVLPMPEGEDDLVISAFAANAVLRAHSDPPGKPGKAGAYAVALKHLINVTKDLTKLRNINLDAESTLREWLSSYEISVRDFSNGDLSPRGLPKEPEKESVPKDIIIPTREKPTVYDQIVCAAVTGFAMHGGLVVDSKLMAERAKAVADAYEGLTNAK